MTLSTETAPIQAGAASDAPAPDPLLGALIAGRYRLLERIGSGGMAHVYRAQDEGLIKREVAIKLMHPETAAQAVSIARTLREAQAIADIHHPNVVQVIDVGAMENGQLYIVMELLRGCSLSQYARGLWSRGEHLSWERLGPMILQVCSALRAAHKRKLVHRDIKPSNCFCTEVDGAPNFIKVLDFGIAKVQTWELQEGLTQEGTFIGTPHYAAPEMISGNAGAPLDGRADIFSLGVMMYELLTESLPFQNEPRLTVLYKTTHERPPSPRSRAPQREISVAVDALIMKAMAIRAEDRFNTVEELAEAIRASLPRDLSLPPVSSESGHTGLPASKPNDLATTNEHAHSGAARRARGPHLRLTALFGLTAFSLLTLFSLILYWRDNSRTVTSVVYDTGSLSTPEMELLWPTPLPLAAETPLSTETPEEPEEPAEELPPPTITSQPLPTTSPPRPSTTRERQRQITQLLGSLIKSGAFLRCLPGSVILADGLQERLPLTIHVDARGQLRAARSTRKVKHRLSPAAESHALACILDKIEAQQLPPGSHDAIPYTLSID